MDARSPATPDERRQLRRIILGDPGSSEFELDSLQYVGLWQSERPVAGSAWRREADGSAILWPPVVLPKCPKPAASAMAALFLAAAEKAKKSQGCRYAMALAGQDDNLIVESLRLAQFSLLADVVLLARDVGAREEFRPRLPGAVVEFSEETEGRFHTVFNDSQAGSQDCAGLRGLRSVEEAFAMFAAAGSSEPGEWMLLEQGTRDVALLLLNEHCEGTALEISYLGVIPAMRRQGIGRSLVIEALRRAKARNFHRVVTAVDVMNEAARGVYDALGFGETSHHHVFFKRLAG